MSIYLIGNLMAKLVDITLKGYKCERCGHMWVPKGEGTPMVCPNCKTPYWQTPRKKEQK